MKTRWLIVAGVFIAPAYTHSVAAADEVAPAMRPPTWSLRVGELVELKLPAAVTASVAPEAVQVMVRSRGAQAVVEPQQGRQQGQRLWQFAPQHQGTHIIVTTIEPTQPAAGGRTFRYEKVFVRVAPRDATASTTLRPSASATARFGHRLELAPLVDPACLLVGADLPIRVKFDGLKLKGATVSVTREPGRGAAGSAGQAKPEASPQTDKRRAKSAAPLRLTTDASASVNVRISSPGLWTVTIEHRPGAERPGGPGVAEETPAGRRRHKEEEPPAGHRRNPDRFVATMTFLVTNTPPE